MLIVPPSVAPTPKSSAEETKIPFIPAPKNAITHIKIVKIMQIRAPHIRFSPKVTSKTPYNAPTSEAIIILVRDVFLLTIIEVINKDKKSMLKFIANKISAYITIKSQPFHIIIKLK